MKMKKENKWSERLSENKLFIAVVIAIIIIALAISFYFIKPYGGVTATFVEKFDETESTISGKPGPIKTSYFLVLRTAEFYQATCYFIDADLDVSNGIIKIVLKNVFRSGEFCGAAITQAEWRTELNYTTGKYLLHIISGVQGDRYELEFFDERIEINPITTSFSEFGDLMYYRTPKSRIVLGCCAPAGFTEKLEICENIKSDLRKIAENEIDVDKIVAEGRYEEYYNYEGGFPPCYRCNPHCTYYDYEGSIDELQRTIEPYIQPPADESDEIYTIVSTLTGEVFCC